MGTVSWPSSTSIWQSFECFSLNVFQVQVSEREAKLSYSQMFKILTEFTGEIPLGVYRTDKLETVPKPNNSTHVEVNDAADEKKNKFDFRRYSSKK